MKIHTINHHTEYCNIFILPALTLQCYCLTCQAKKKNYIHENKYITDKYIFKQMDKRTLF